MRTGSRAMRREQRPANTRAGGHAWLAAIKMCTTHAQGVGGSTTHQEDVPPRKCVSHHSRNDEQWREAAQEEAVDERALAKDPFSSSSIATCNGSAVAGASNASYLRRARSLPRWSPAQPKAQCACQGVEVSAPAYGVHRPCLKKSDFTCGNTAMSEHDV